MVQEARDTDTAPAPGPHFTLNPFHINFSNFLSHVGVSQDVTLILSAVVVGALTGLGAVFFIWLMHQISLGTDWLRSAIGMVGGTLLAMGSAGIVVGWMIDRWAREAKGHGVPEVMEAIAMRGGRIRSPVAAVKVIASSLTIGTGGSAGREGPIVQVGSALGSMLAQWLHFSDERIRTLVACGSAAGIAATFNAPIAGAIFALEVILGNFTVRYFGVVVISAVSASITSRAFFGDVLAFHVPAYPLNDVRELPIYVVLGLLSALVAVAFIKMLYSSEHVFDAWRVPLYVRTAVGMLLTGVVGLFFYDYGILGPGLHAIGETAAMNVNLSVTVLAMILVAKMLATSLTLGSGNSGGVFAPSLFMGATLGGIVGLAANHFWPGIAPNPGAYAIVGMAATFSGAARAPITAVLIVFEMSSDYKLIIPLMLATVLSTLIAEALHDESIYTLKLKEKGIRWQRGRDIDVLQSVTVGEIISRNFDSVPADFTLPELTERFEQTHRHGLPILDEDGKLCGLLTISDLDRALDDNKPSETTALEIGVPLRDLLVTTPEETMGAALALMGTRGLGRLPVVDPTDRSRLLGMVRRSDIIRAYYIALARRAEIQHRAKRQAMTNIDGTIFTDFILEEGDKAVGKRLAELSPNFPKACILVSIRRSGRLLIPHGETVFQAGDKVTVFVNTQDVDQIQSCLRQNSAGQEEHVAEHEG